MNFCAPRRSAWLSDFDQPGGIARPTTCSSTRTGPRCVARDRRVARSLALFAVSAAALLSTPLHSLDAASEVANREKFVRPPRPAVSRVDSESRSGPFDAARLAERRPKLRGSLASSAAEPNRFDTLVVCPRDFREALQPWLDYRAAQGHRIAVIESEPTSEQLRAQIAKWKAAHPLKHLVLVGDTWPRRPADGEAEGQTLRGPRGREPDAELLKRRYVPTCYLEAQVNVNFGSEPRIATDLGYVDFDEDYQPELAVGRLPVDSPGQLSEWIARIQRYEQTPHDNFADRRVNIVAGPGNFGPIADSLLEMTAKRFIRDEIPPAYDIQTMFTSPSSPYCPAPPELVGTNVEQLNAGSLFWVYIGHGQTWYLHPLYHQTTYFPLFDTRATRQLACRSLPPIAVFFCCYSGAYDWEHDCLAEEMVLEPGGPIAAFGASRVSMPFAMSMMADALLAGHFEGQHQTLGELIQAAKRRSLEPVEDAQDERAWMQVLAQLFSPTRAVLAEELQENAALFNLLGDPLLRVRRAGAVQVAAPRRHRAGEPVNVQGTLPQAGRLTLELVYRRDRQLPGVQRRDPQSARDVARWQQDFTRANDRLCSYRVVDLPAGDFEIELTVPRFARGACYVRACLHHADGCDLGAAPIFIRTAESAADAQGPQSRSTDRR